MKSSQARSSDDLGAGGRSFLRRSAKGRVAQARVHPLEVGVYDELEEQAPEVRLVDDDHVVKPLPMNRSNRALGEAALPR